MKRAIENRSNLKILTSGEYFQPKIGIKIGIFSLGQKINILIDFKNCMCKADFYEFAFMITGKLK